MLPAAGAQSSGNGSSSEDETTSPRVSKSFVLASAVDYIRKLERERNKLSEEKDQLVTAAARARKDMEILHKRLRLTEAALRVSTSSRASQ